MAEIFQFPSPAGDRDEDQVDETPTESAAETSLPTLGAGVIAERALRPYTTRPILPAWLTSAEDRRTAARWAVGYTAHIAAFHAVRMPLYAGRLALYSPRGLWRGLCRAAAWLTDWDTAPLHRALAAAGDAVGYETLARRRAERVRQRLIVAGVATGGAAIALGVGLYVWPWALWPLIGSATGIAGYAGRRRDKTLIDSAMVMSGPAPRLTADVVLRALGALGIGEINKALAGKGSGVTFAAPITRDGPGWRADVDLPHGVVAADVIEKRDKLASGLRRPLGCVWPELVHDIHTGRLVLWVGDEDMAKARAAAWPLAKAGGVDLFQAIPWGVDSRGRRVDVSLIESNVLIGAMPGAGKTSAMRVLLLAAALDPRVQLDVFELKGSGDLSSLASVCHDYASGGGDSAVEATLERLREVAEDLERRAETISQLPRSVAPDSKVTPELARRRSLGLHLRVIAIDECQQIFAHGEYGKEAAELSTKIIKLGRAFGIILILATQRPDRESLPKAISANVGIRLGMRLMDHVSNDMVLGTGAHRNGVRATDLTLRDRGIGWLVGAREDAVIMRAAVIDGPAAERIVTRARAAREAAGTIVGYAAGEVPDRGPEYDMLADLVLVLGSEDKAHSDVLCARLAEQWPTRYAGWEPAQLAAALKPYGITTRQTWAVCINGVACNHAGIVRQDVLQAIRD